MGPPSMLLRKRLRAAANANFPHAVGRGEGRQAGLSLARDAAGAGGERHERQRDRCCTGGSHADVAAAW
eukprot:9211210-Alexandrium_andersonii.AAC.1